jgi:hypothetical protein
MVIPLLILALISSRPGPRRKTSGYFINIFDIIEPNHPCTGGLTIEDVQRRLAQYAYPANEDYLTRCRQVAELHLDDRIQSSRDVIGKHLATSQKKVSTAFSNLWNDIEAMREAQRIRAAEEKAAAVASGSTKEGKAGGSSKCSFYAPKYIFWKWLTTLQYLEQTWPRHRHLSRLLLRRLVHTCRRGVRGPLRKGRLAGDAILGVLHRQVALRRR